MLSPDRIERTTSRAQPPERVWAAGGEATLTRCVTEPQELAGLAGCRHVPA